MAGWALLWYLAIRQVFHSDPLTPEVPERSPYRGRIGAGGSGYFFFFLLFNTGTGAICVVVNRIFRSSPDKYLSEMSIMATVGNLYGAGKITHL